MKNPLLDKRILSYFDKYQSYENCKKCGKCCKKNVVISFVEAQFLEDKQWVNNGGGCPFLSRKGCSVYEDRPILCRLFGNKKEEHSSVVFLEKMEIAHDGYCLKANKTVPGLSVIDRHIWTNLYAIGGAYALSFNHPEKILKNLPVIKGFAKNHDGKVIFVQNEGFSMEKSKKLARELPTPSRLMEVV
jgi:Fe-S-cluster containining protein